MQPNNQVQKPFFAQFLESQANVTEQQNSWEGTGKLIDAPGGDVTQKFPSDNDEEWL
jgi:hypothetical protein